MTDPHEVLIQRQVEALHESTDAANRLAAVMQRNTQALTWHAAVIVWVKTPFWKRGPAPRWQG